LPEAKEINRASQLPINKSYKKKYNHIIEKMEIFPENDSISITN